MEHPRKGSSARGARRGIFLERGEQRLHDSLGKLGAPSARVVTKGPGCRIGSAKGPPQRGFGSGFAISEQPW